MPDFIPDDESPAFMPDEPGEAMSKPVSKATVGSLAAGMLDAPKFIPDKPEDYGQPLDLEKLAKPPPEFQSAFPQTYPKQIDAPFSIEGASRRVSELLPEADKTPWRQALNEAGQTLIGKPLHALQRNVGKPLVEGLVLPAMKLSGGLGPQAQREAVAGAVGAVAQGKGGLNTVGDALIGAQTRGQSIPEWLTRQAGAFAGGETVPLSEGEATKPTNELAQILGEKNYNFDIPLPGIPRPGSSVNVDFSPGQVAAAGVQSVSSTLGELPVILMGTPASGAVSSAIASSLVKKGVPGLLAETLGGATAFSGEGAFLGGLQAAGSKNGDIVEGALGGAIGGGLLGGAMPSVARGFSKAAEIAGPPIEYFMAGAERQLTKALVHDVDAFTKMYPELWQHSFDAQVADATAKAQKALSKESVIITGRPAPKDLKPMFISLTEGPGGSTVARMTELKAGTSVDVPAQVRTHDVLMRSAEDYNKLQKQYPEAVTIPPGSLGGDLPSAPEKFWDDYMLSQLTDSKKQAQMSRMRGVDLDSTPWSNPSADELEWLIRRREFGFSPMEREEFAAVGMLHPDEPVTPELLQRLREPGQAQDVVQVGVDPNDRTVALRRPGSARAARPSEDVTPFTVGERTAMKVEQAEHLEETMPEFAPLTDTKSKSTLEFIRSQRFLDAASVSEKLKLSLPEAQQMLDGWQREGLIRTQRNGFYVDATTAKNRAKFPSARPPNEPPKAPVTIFNKPPRNGAKEGFFVAYGDPQVEGGVRHGVYRGPSKEHPNYYRVEERQPDGTTVMKEMMEREFNTLYPEGLGQKALATLPPTVGYTEPMPLEYTQPTQEQFNALVATGRKITSANLQPNALKQFLNAFTPIFNLGEKNIRGKLTRTKAAQMLYPREKAEQLRRIRELMPDGKMFSPAAAELLALTEHKVGSPEANAIWKKYALKDPLGAVKMAEPINNMLKEIQLMDRELADMGIKPVAHARLARDMGLRGEYVTQTFMLRQLGDDWVKHLESQLPARLDAATTYLHKNAAKKAGALGRGEVTPYEVQRDLMEALLEVDPIDALSRKGYRIGTNAQAKGSLMKKSEIPKPILDVLGPTNSLPLQLAETYARQKHLKSVVGVWNELSQSPNWSRMERPDTPLQVPNEPIFGKAAGGWVGPEFKPLLDMVHLPAQVDLLRNVMGVLGRNAKRNMILWGGAVPWANNIARSYRQLVFTGALNPYEVMSGFQTGREAARMMRAHMKDPTRFGSGQLLNEAREFGSVPSGSAGIDVHQFERKLRNDILMELEKGGPGGWIDAMKRVRDNVMSKYHGVNESAQAAYGIIDEFHRMWSHLYLRNKFLKQGMTPSNAAEAAARVINNASPNMEIMSPFGQGLRDSGTVGMLAPFAAASAEDLRVLGHQGARMVESLVPGRAKADPTLDPALAARIIGAVGTVAMLHQGMRAWRNVQGITDEEVDAAYASLPHSTRNIRSPFMTAGLAPDDQGRIPFYDFATQWEPMLGVSRGSPQDHPAARVVRNMLMEIIGQESPAGGMLNLASQQAGMTPLPTFNVRPPVTGEGGVGTALNFLARSGPLPQAPFRIADALAKTENKTLNPKEAWTASQAGQRIAGLPFIAAASPRGDWNTIAPRQKEASFANSKLKQELRAWVRNHPLSDPKNQEAFQRILGAQFDVRKMRQDDLNEMWKLIGEVTAQDTQQIK